MARFNDIIPDPEWVPHRFDGQGDRVQFVRITREKRRQLPFLANFKPTAESETLWVAGNELRQAETLPAPVHFIFHTAFCRSTLIVKLLDHSGYITGLSEPLILNDLTSQLGNAKTNAMILPILNCLAKPLPTDRIIVIKPSNHANQLIPLLLRAKPDAQGLILSSQLPSFLRSVISKGMEGKVWARRLFLEIGRYAPLDLGLTNDEMYELTDLQIIGLAWLLHQRHCAALLASPMGDRLQTLDADDFIARREDTIRALLATFGITLEKGEASKLAKHKIFDKNAKSGEKYSALSGGNGPSTDSLTWDPAEMGYVVDWIENIIDRSGMNLSLGKSLLD